MFQAEEVTLRPGAENVAHSVSSEWSGLHVKYKGAVNSLGNVNK